MPDDDLTAHLRELYLAVSCCGGNLPVAVITDGVYYVRHRDGSVEAFPLWADGDPSYDPEDPPDPREQPAQPMSGDNPEEPMASGQPPKPGPPVEPAEN